MGEQADDRRAGRAQATIQLQAEDSVGELRLPVGLARGVAVYELEVVEVDVAGLVLEARERDYARGLGPPEPLEQQPRQSEMAQVVGPELELEAVGGLAAAGAS